MWLLLIISEDRRSTFPSGVSAPRAPHPLVSLVLPSTSTMDEPGSQARFTALVSGTVADQILKNHHTSPATRQRQSGDDHSLSPGSYEEQLPCLFFSKRIDGHIDDSTSGDLIRRGRRAEGPRRSLLDPERFSSPSQASVGCLDEQRSTPGVQRAPPQQREFVKLRTSKSMHQRSDVHATRPEQSSMYYENLCFTR